MDEGEWTLPTPAHVWASMQGVAWWGHDRRDEKIHGYHPSSLWGLQGIFLVLSVHYMKFVTGLIIDWTLYLFITFLQAHLNSIVAAAREPLFAK